MDLVSIGRNYIFIPIKQPVLIKLLMEFCMASLGGRFNFMSAT